MADYTFGIGDELQFTTQDTDLIHAWNFGDGTTSTDPNPSHTYNSAGLYTITHTASDFCDTCSIAGTHTVEITQASITVKSILLDKYTANVGDIITITVIAQNQSSVAGTSTISIDFGGVLSSYNVTLSPNQETSFNVQEQVTTSGIIDICADNVCTVLFVNSNISVKSITAIPAISTGDIITITVTVKNDGGFTESKDIQTSLTNTQTAVIDTRTVTLAPNESQYYDIILDVRALSLPNGTYTVCANGMCKAISVAIPPQTGNLNVVSIPTGAQIFIDSQTRGITDTTITDINSGDHSFSLVLSGYNVTNGTITIVGGMTSYIYTSLIPEEATTGSIAISSIPTNADIYLDDVQQLDINNQPLRTPATLSGISPGLHKVTLKLSGYDDYNNPNVNVEAGITSYLSASLLQSPILFGDINFTSVPAGAEILLDGNSTGKTTPYTITDVDIGSHSFTLRLLGYNDLVGHIDVVGGITSYVYATLVTISPLKGSLSISSNPQGAEIYIDNIKQLDVNNQPLVTPATIQNIDPKSGYAITLKKKGYQDLTATVSVVAGQTTYLGVTLQRTQVVSAGFPWWIVAGLAVGMYVAEKKREEKELEKDKAELEKTRKELVSIREQLMEVPKLPLTDQQKHLVAKLREKGITGLPICKDGVCKVEGWDAVSIKGRKPIIIHESSQL